jgi:plastocyanin
MRVRRLILLAGAIAVVACSDDGNGGQGPGNGDGDGDETPEGDILVRNNLFEPSGLEVAPGATVVWAWASGGTVHNVTFTEGPNSGNKGSGTFERTFADAGQFPYLCTIHGQIMSGVISVVATPAPGDGGGDGGGDGDGGGGGGGYP